MRTVCFTPVVGNLNRSNGNNGAPSQAYTNSVPDQHSIYPGGQHTLAFYTKCAMLEEHVVVVDEAWCLELTQRSPLENPRLLQLKDTIVLPTIGNSNEVARARQLRYYPHTDNDRFIGLVRSSRPGQQDSPSWVKPRMPSPHRRGLTNTRTACFTPVVGNLNRIKETNVTPGQACTNSVPDQQFLYPDGQHTLTFYIKCVMPVGVVACVC